MNLYIDAFGGANYVESCTKHGVRVDLDCGYVAGGSIGCRFARFFRIEGEAAYRENAYDQVVVKNLKLRAHGANKAITAMGNALIETPLFNNCLILMSSRRWRTMGRENLSLLPSASNEDFLDIDKWRKSGHTLVGQGIVGLSVPICRNLQGAVEYRYLDGEKNQANTH